MNLRPMSVLNGIRCGDRHKIPQLKMCHGSFVIGIHSLWPKVIFCLWQSHRKLQSVTMLAKAIAKNQPGVKQEDKSKTQR